MGGASSKSRFADGFADLLTKDIDPSDHEFWDELWKATLTIDEVFELISFSDARKLILERPANLRTLFTQGVVQLYQVVETPFPQYFEQAQNCIRVLTRLVPIMLETYPKEVHELLWVSAQSEAQMDEGTVHGAGTGASRAGEDEGAIEAEPLAVILINTIYHLLFLPEFSIDDPVTQFSEKDVNSQEFKSALMWAVGVGSAEKTILNATDYDETRAELLKLMIAIFCDPLYQPADQYDSCSSMWLEVATSEQAPYAEICFYSLINTVLGYDPVGWGMPYGNMVSTDTAKIVMESAVQVLIVLLDYGYPIRHQSASAASSDPYGHLPYVLSDDTDARGFNVYRRFLGAVSAPDQLNFMYRGFLRLLNNAHQADSTYLPYSITRVGIEQELLILLWKCLEENPRFMPYILAQCDVTELLVPICYFMLESRKDLAKVGLMYLCTFTLLKLSGERNFGVSLNKPYFLSLPVDIPLFTGNHADLLIIVLHKLIVSGSERLSSLYNCFLTIICNISPYCKTLSSASAVKIVNMFQLFSSPAFFFAAESNYTFSMLLLETINNIVQYQYEGHANLVYAILRRKDVFEKLMNVSMFNTGFEGDPSKSRGVGSSANNSSNNSNSIGSRKNSISSPAPVKVGKRKEPAAEDDLDPSSVASTPVPGPRGTLLSPSPGAQGDDEADDALESKMSSLAAAGKRMQHATTDMVSTLVVERRAGSDGETHEDVMSPPATPMRPENAAVKGAAVDVATEAAAAPCAPATAPPEPTEQPVAASHQFVPTGQWLETVKSSLPLQTVSRLLRSLLPQVEAMLSAEAEQGGAVTADGIQTLDEGRMLEFIQTTTMVGLLPVPHPIVIRKYQANKFTSLWFTAFEFGVIFMHNQNLAMFDGSKIRLFTVQTVADED